MVNGDEFGVFRDTFPGMFCSDLDGTLLGDEEGMARFTEMWGALEEKPVLVYSTGRLDSDAKRMIRLHGLPEPDFYTTGVGTMIHDVSAGGMLGEFSELLDEGWDLKRVDEVVGSMPGIERQPEEQQHAWKSSWFWEERSGEEISRLRGALEEAGLAVQVVYSTGRDLDVLPAAANKGNALGWLAERVGVGRNRVVVAGDSGNDASMFLLNGVRGIVPGNASPELVAEIRGRKTVFFAKGSCAAGVVEGLRHFGIFSNIRTKEAVEKL